MVEDGKKTSDIDSRNYVDRRLNEMARQNAEAVARNIDNAYRIRKERRDVYLERTTLLRAYLQSLAPTINELLNHFHTREVLEALRDRYYKGGSITEVKPPIYRDVVSLPDPTQDYFDIFDARARATNRVWLSQLEDLDEIRRLIPTLEGYGLKLDHTSEIVETEEGRVGVWTMNPYVYGDQLISVVESGPSGHFVRLKTKKEKRVKINKSITVVSASSEKASSKHDLVCYRSQSVSPEHWIYKDAFYETRITAGQDEDALMKTVGLI